MGVYIYQILSNRTFKICVFHFMYALFQFKIIKEKIVYVYKCMCWYIYILFNFRLHAYQMEKKKLNALFSNLDSKICLKLVF